LQVAIKKQKQKRNSYEMRSIPVPGNFCKEVYRSN
jgi:hypothetical protein